MAKKVIAVAKFIWALYYQWRHSTPPPSNTAKTDGAIDVKEESSHDPESPGAKTKTNEKPGRGVNGGRDKSGGESESDEGASKDKDGAAAGGDGASKVKRRRGTYVIQNYVMVL